MGRKTRWGLALGAALALSACGSVGGAGAPRSTATDVALADLALASLAKGDYAQAEIFVDRAMQAKAQDPYALLAAGLLYQNTNRPVEAVRVYKTLVHLAPQDEATVGAWFHLERRPLTDIAQGNLEILAMLPATAAAMAEPVAPPRQMAAAAGASANDGEGPRSLVPSSQAPAVTASAPLVPPVGPVVAPTSRPFIDPASVTAVIGRFLTLNRLLADGLMTQDEYTARRSANIGALLPLTHPAPGAGLGLPAPTPDEVVDRLRTLRSALADGALTQEQFAAERLAILDALLPAQPRERARLMPPPTLPAEGKIAEERVRAMRAAGLVSVADVGAETAAIQRSLRTAAPKPATVARPATAGGHAPNGVHLASYKSEAAAREAWKDMTRRFPALQGLSPRVVPTDLGAKGVFMRLEAGPVSSPQALCQSLKQAGQYCAPVAL